MWWNAGCHTNGNTLCSVYQKVRHLYRKYFRLFFCFVKVWHKIYYIFIQIRKVCFLGNLLQAGLGISHRSRPISLDGTKVTMTIYQWQSFLKFLCHYHQCIINGAVTVRMIFTHSISHDTGTFTIRFIITDAKFVHIIKCSSLYRLQTISDIRQCSCYNNTHGIIDIRFLHYFRIFGADNLFFRFHNLSNSFLIFCFYHFPYIHKNMLSAIPYGFIEIYMSSSASFALS